MRNHGVTGLAEAVGLQTERAKLSIAQVERIMYDRRGTS